MTHRTPAPSTKARARLVARDPMPLLSLETLRRQCELVAIDVDSDGVESHPDDGLLAQKLEDAIDFAEDFTGRAIALGTWEAALDAFPTSELELPRPPLVNVSEFYAGNDSEGLLLEGEDYVLDTFGEVASLRPVTTWPASPAGPNGIRVTFRAGYRPEGAESSDSDAIDAPLLPGAIRSALLLIVAHLYENREETTEKALSALPLGVSHFLRPKRVRLGAA